jgi:glycosyltransferase involved in cell wall biosynthesis
LADPRFHLSLAALLRRLRPTVVHTHHFSPLLAASAARLLAGAPRLVHTEHSFEYLKDRPDYRRTLAALSRSCAVFSVLGEQMVPYYAEQVRVPASRLAVIPNGVDLSRFVPVADRRAERVALGLPPDGFLVGTAGRLEAEKHYGLLIRAFARAFPDRDGAVLVIAGDGAERAPLEALAADLALGDRVRFLGWRTDVPRIVGALDLFALSSHHEGLPMAILEAMASRVPVVSTAVGNIPLVVRDGETGLLVPAGDEHAYADALARAEANRARVSALGAAARATVERDYSQDTMVRRYLTAYGL